MNDSMALSDLSPEEFQKFMQIGVVSTLDDLHKESRPAGRYQIRMLEGPLVGRVEVWFSRGGRGFHFGNIAGPIYHQGDFDPLHELEIIYLGE